MRFEELSEAVVVNKGILDSLISSDLEKLSQLYRQSGHELRIVGGAVRDILLKKRPKDIDLASDATPEESIELLEANDIRVILTGVEHGTITAHIDGEDYEITTLRIDKDTDGRHATVEYTRDWELDANRRDLTFNAMSLDFDGNLYDYFGGYEDLTNGIARFVGDTERRIQEDYLRILRYFRFQGRMVAPTFDDETLAAISKNVSGLKNISGERIWMEMNKILGGFHVEELFVTMKSVGVLEEVGLEQANLYELSHVIPNTKEPVLRLASLLNNEAEIEKLFGYWKFPKAVKQVLDFVVVNREVSMTLEKAKLLLAQYGIDKKLIIRLLQYQGKENIINDFRAWKKPVFPVDGNDLISIGYSPGVEFGKTLQYLKKEWAESGYTLTKKELLDIIEA
jgi:tRNA nucleotidyltransferase (CCA-adding enzyme)